MAKGDTFEILRQCAASKDPVGDYCRQNTPEILQMVLGKIMHYHAKPERWPTPWRMVVMDGKGIVCGDFKYTPGQPHEFYDIESEHLGPDNGPWTVTLSARDGREQKRTVTLKRCGNDLLWESDGDEVERCHIATNFFNPTMKNPNLN